MIRQYTISGTRCLENDIILHFSIFNGSLLMLHQLDKTFKTICNKKALSGKFICLNNFKSSVKRSLLEC